MENEIWFFSIAEIYLLAGLLQCSNLAGIEEPYKGFLIDEIQQQMEAARQSLIDRIILIPVEYGFELDEEVGQLFGLISKAPRMIVGCHRTAGRNQKNMVIYADSGNLLVQESMPDERIAFYKMDPIPLKQHMKDFLFLSPVKESNSQNISLKYECFESAMKIALDEGVTAVIHYLAEHNLSEMESQALGLVLAKDSQASLAIIERTAREISSNLNLNWIVNENMGWSVVQVNARGQCLAKLEPVSFGKFDRIFSSIGI